MDSRPQKTPLWNSFRLSVAFWGFLASSAIYTLRFSFSVAIVCMTYDPVTNETDTANVELKFVHGDPIHHYILSWFNENPYNDDCEGDIGGDDENITGEFDWSRSLRGTITSSFFWGYVLTQLFGGWVSQKVGGKFVVFAGVLVSGITTILSAPAARLSPYALMSMRFINGLGQGVYFPAFYNLMGSWFPLPERSILEAVFGSGTAMGSVLSFALSGVICADLGWNWIFHIFGIGSLLVCILWWIFVHDTPASHPRISTEEREYIEFEFGIRKNNATKKYPIPWRSLLTSVVVWSLIVSDFCKSWGAYMGLTLLPQYMEDVLNFDIKSNGLYSSLPQLAKFFLSFVFALIGDRMISRHILSVTKTRKIFHTLSTLVPGLLVLGVGYIDCNTAWLAVLLLTLQDGMTAANRAGSAISRVDIAPKFSGIVMGICNTAGNMAGIVTPLVVSAVTSEGTREQWKICFFMSSGFYFIAWIAFIVFGNSEEQEWAKVGDDQEITKEVSIELPETNTEQEKDSKPISQEEKGDIISTYI